MKKIRRRDKRERQMASRLYIKAFKILQIDPFNREAIALIKKSSNLGHFMASHTAAHWHLHQSHYSKAVYYLRRSFPRIHESARLLGKCYENGTGVRPNKKKAFLYYTTGAKKWGDMRSLYQVGRCLNLGIGTRPDRDLARKIFAITSSFGINDRTGEPRASSGS